MQNVGTILVVEYSALWDNLASAGWGIFNFLLVQQLTFGLKQLS